MKKKEVESADKKKGVTERVEGELSRSGDDNEGRVRKRERRGRGRVRGDQGEWDESDGVYKEGREICNER